MLAEQLAQAIGNSTMYAIARVAEAMDKDHQVISHRGWLNEDRKAASIAASQSEITLGNKSFWKLLILSEDGLTHVLFNAVVHLSSLFRIRQVLWNTFELMLALLCFIV